MEEAMNMVIMKQCFITEGPKLLLSSKNKLCKTKVFKNDFQLSSCLKELLLRCCKHSGSAYDGNASQKVILLWRKQPSKLIQ